MAPSLQVRPVHAMVQTGPSQPPVQASGHTVGSPGAASGSGQPASSSPPQAASRTPATATAWIHRIITAPACDQNCTCVHRINGRPRSFSATARESFAAVAAGVLGRDGIALVGTWLAKQATTSSIN
jgi:hypothetical protein